jgi:hypothetical protein
MVQPAVSVGLSIGYDLKVVKNAKKMKGGTYYEMTKVFTFPAKSIAFISVARPLTLGPALLVPQRKLPVFSVNAPSLLPTMGNPL